jgi:serine/threonine-protein kinase
MVAVLAGLGAIAYMLFRTPTHPIPDVAGLDRDAAVAEVDDFDWSISFEDVRSDAHPTPGEVVRTAPAAGEDLAEGSPLLVFVSQGPEFRQVPDLSGMTLDDAQAEIASLKLTAKEPTQQFSETVPKGTVISSASGEGVPIGGDVLPGSEITLVVSAGPQPRTAPQLRGLSQQDATQVLTDIGLTIAVGDPVFDNDVAVDDVAAQAPAPGQPVPRGGTITIRPSKGPDYVDMPDLSGMPLPTVRATLEGAGLVVGPVLGSTTGTFYAASIDGEQVQPGDQVIRGSTVSLIIL